MPKNIPVNFIFSVFWKPNSQTESDKPISFMSTVYTVTYTRAIQPKITEIEKVIDKDDKTLVLDGSTSVFLNAEALGLRKVGGIVYNWICEEPFAEYCQSWNNSPVV